MKKSYICLRCNGTWKWDSETREKELIPKTGSYSGIHIAYTLPQDFIDGSIYCTHCASTDVKEINE